MARVGRKRVKAYQEPVVWATVQALPHMGEDSCYLNPVTHKVVWAPFPDGETEAQKMNYIIQGR